MAPTTANLTAFLALAAASPSWDAAAFTPIPRLGHRQASVRLSASTQDDENVVVDVLRKASGGAAAFLAGMGIMAQVAMADPSAIAPIDGVTSQVQSSTASSNVLLSAGAPTFGGGGSFDTLDFSLPSYDQATSGAQGSELTKSSDNADAAANAAAKEEARKAAEVEKEAQRKADAEAKEAKKQAEADAKVAAEKAAAEKAAAKEARIAAEKEKQRLAVERQKAKEAEEVASPVESIKDKMPELPSVSDIKVEVPDLKVPDIPDVKFPSFSMPKIDVPEFKAPDISIPSPPKVDIPKPAAAPDIAAPKFDMPKVDVPAMPSFSMPKIDIPSPPKIDIPAPAAKYDFDTPSFSLPGSSSAPSSPGVEFADSQEVRDARAAEKNSDFKAAQAEAKEAEKAAKAAQNKAKEAKKAFKEAKGDACATRPGGKILCLRGLGIGY